MLYKVARNHENTFSSIKNKKEWVHFILGTFRKTLMKQANIYSFLVQFVRWQLTNRKAQVVTIASPLKYLANQYNIQYWKSWIARFRTFRNIPQKRKLV